MCSSDLHCRCLLVWLLLTSRKVGLVRASATVFDFCFRSPLLAIDVLVCWNSMDFLRWVGATESVCGVCWMAFSGSVPLERYHGRYAEFLGERSLIWRHFNGIRASMQIMRRLSMLWRNLNGSSLGKWSSLDCFRWVGTTWTDSGWVRYAAGVVRAWTKTDFSSIGWQCRYMQCLWHMWCTRCMRGIRSMWCMQ